MTMNDAVADPEDCVGDKVESVSHNTVEPHNTLHIQGTYLEKAGLCLFALQLLFSLGVSLQLVCERSASTLAVVMLHSTYPLILLVLLLLAEFNLALFPPPEPENTNRPTNCYAPHSTAPQIVPDDCRTATRALIASGSGAMHPEVWGPGITPAEHWTWASCGILLIPNTMQSSDTFSRLEMAEAATRIVSGCVNAAHQWKGGWTRFGEKGVFKLAVKGRPTPRLLKGVAVTEGG